MDVTRRSPLITYATCPDCRSPRALVAYERPDEPIYFCRECEHARNSRRRVEQQPEIRVASGGRR